MPSSKKQKKETEFSAFRNSVVIKLIMTTVCEGKGIEGDPMRLVHYYCDFDGNVLFKSE